MTVGCVGWKAGWLAGESIGCVRVRPTGGSTRRRVAGGLETGQGVLKTGLSGCEGGEKSASQFEEDVARRERRDRRIHRRPTEDCVQKTSSQFTVSPHRRARADLSSAASCGQQRQNEKTYSMPEERRYTFAVLIAYANTNRHIHILRQTYDRN
ncbi:unnamed protein product [Protopolystoma xenopodis]|uniref:Uncharacterized protein n=1 Tax=Protopolystoma xenopodis TaxID=117903 RepID=A0A448XMV9_9PLAT|nr:unnamed protein product [Protopolystoma xenopodis]